MSSLYYFQYLLYSLCIYLFIVYSYVVFYSDLFSIHFRDDLLPEYDYIIVGSGTAGSVIAHRLATETNYTFIVLEAGSRGHFLMDIPIVGPALHRSLFDWKFETVPQDYACWAMEGRKCRLPQGKILGGSSKLNNMIHIRGNISHYMQWFHDKHTHKYIKEQFDFIENNIIKLDDISYESDIANAVLSAAKELGFTNSRSADGLGFSKSRLSQKNGKRWSTSDNLNTNKHIVTHAFVEKVIIENDHAKGVILLLGEKEIQILAKKGVIISAGTFNSPKILQLSGLGPSKLLKALEIPVVKDLPVGENLQDHVGTGLDLVLLNRYPKIGAHDIVNPLNSIKYFLQGNGPLTTPGCEVVGFISTKNHSTPDLQYMVLPMGISSDRGSRLRKSLGIKNEVWDRYFVNLFDKYTASIVPIILHPKSKGTVYINSTDYKAPPMIDPKYLSHKNDREILIQGLKFVMNFLQTKSMKDIGSYINSTPFPGCENYETFSDKYFDCYMKYLTLSSYHPVGTCSMGLPGNSVVDTNFQVFGVNNLFVADASVLPSLPSGNINAAVAMMGSVFFESNIKRHIGLEVCYNYKYNVFKELLLNICLSSPQGVEKL